MIYKCTINDQRFEIDFYVTSSLMSFDDPDLVFEEIICLDTGCGVDPEDIITPEIEEKLIAYYLDNYDPTP